MKHSAWVVATIQRAAGGGYALTGFFCASEPGSKLTVADGRSFLTHAGPYEGESFGAACDSAREYCADWIRALYKMEIQ